MRAASASNPQASTAVVPTQPAAQATTSSAEDPTMAAVRQTAVVFATQTEVANETQAAAPAGAGGGAESTPTVEGTPSANQVASATPAANDTPVAPVATDVPTMAAPTAAPTAVTACSSPYVVQQGDWIYKIARTCNVDPAAIVAANPGVNYNFITPGQKLNMPASAGSSPVAAQPTAAAACTGNYTVARGDTLYSIAYRCGLTTEQLATANSIRSPYVIHPGDVLKFP